VILLFSTAIEKYGELMLPFMGKIFEAIFPTYVPLLSLVSRERERRD